MLSTKLTLIKKYLCSFIKLCPAYVNTPLVQKQIAQQATRLTSKFAIVNFNRSTLGQEGGGHFSPVAAYDPTTDSALIMDVARYKVRWFNWIYVYDFSTILFAFKHATCSILRFGSISKTSMHH